MPKKWDSRKGKYTMATASNMTDTEAHRIRRFEKAGLIDPERTDGGQRLFSDDDIGKIKEIAELEDEGINLKGAEEMMKLRRGQRK